MAAGVGHVIVGVVLTGTLFTTSETLAEAVLYLELFDGVKVTESVLVPTVGTVPAAGEYANAPGTEAAASSCMELSAVP